MQTQKSCQDCKQSDRKDNVFLGSHMTGGTHASKEALQKQANFLTKQMQTQKFSQEKTTSFPGKPHNWGHHASSNQGSQFPSPNHMLRAAKLNSHVKTAKSTIFCRHLTKNISAKNRRNQMPFFAQDRSTNVGARAKTESPG